MNRFAFAIVLFSAGTAFLCAQQEKPVAKPVQPPASCIWKVAGKNGNTIFLAGSVHLLRDQDYPIPPAYDAVYDKSLRLVFEIDMRKMEDPSELLKIREKGLYPAGDSLKKHLSKKTWRLLEKYIRKNNLQQMQMERMRPGFAYLTISSLETMKLGAKPELGLEGVFFQKSKKDAKPSGGLETMEFQLNLFNELSDEEQDEMLREGLTSIDETAESIDEMIGAWKNGNAKELDRLMTEQFEENAKIRELLLTNRNKDWIPHIEEAMEGKQNVMFLVGAGHLVGKDSVVDLLRKKGYTVEQVAHDSTAKAEAAAE
ncbi:MAG: TraB/GumN family protein [Verrucomicrobiales bacterium]|nr:TraB/GumN family protein [Verrucomicrobiales bacterium]